MKYILSLALILSLLSCSDSSAEEGQNGVNQDAQKSEAPMSFEDYTEWITEQIDEGSYNDAINALKEAVKYYPEESKAAQFDLLIEKVENFQLNSEKIQREKNKLK